VNGDGAEDERTRRQGNGLFACSGVKMSVCVGGFLKLCLSSSDLKLENA
jgi:hypothetical protein